ncbi:hypothetical protein [Jiangella anatolica]|uniref:Septum formation-related domain-containing protein n=1 Tax=Jiangella anatolica TaxID=2670374 RepID=A0A2W2CQ26_9ACTN|nr:hypothetical protein [Jiangella anatolica]PZF82343.1 hypothetical protein C1I92_17095 [Jiangella anatolica]
MTIRKAGHTVRTVCRLAIAGALTLALSAGAVLTTTGSASASKIHAIGVVTPPAPPDRLEPASFREVHAYLYPDSTGRAGGYVSCPQGMKAVTGGATAAAPNAGLLTGLTPTYDGNGWYASAVLPLWAPDTGVLDLEVICAWPEQLSSVATLTRTVQAQYDSSIHTTHYRDFRGCPDGKALFGGGAFTTQDGVIVNAPSGGSGPFLNAMAPLGSFWVNGSAKADSPTTGVAMESYLRCIDPFQLGTSVSATASGPSRTDGVQTTVTAFCPSGHTAYTGGAYWTDGHGSLRISHISFNRTAWTAQGKGNNGASLQVEVRCIRTDQVATPPVIATLNSVPR